MFAHVCVRACVCFGFSSPTLIIFLDFSKHLEHCLSTEEQNRTKQFVESQHIIEQLISDVKQKELKARRAAERSAELEMDLSRNAEQLQELKSMFNNQMDYLTERSQQKIEIQVRYLHRIKMCISLLFHVL